jgi:hypothetical protein
MKGGLPLAALAGGLLLYHGLKGGQQRTQAGAERQNLEQRMGNAANNAGVVASLRGGAPLDSVGSAIYNNERAASGEIGDAFMFDKGAAAHVVEAGRLLAKNAGIGGAVLGGIKSLATAGAAKIPKIGLGTKLLAGGAALGAGYGAMKAGKGLYNYGMKPAETRTLGGHNAGLPQYANQFGVPEMG